MQAGGELPDLLAPILPRPAGVHREPAGAALQRHLDRLDRAGLLHALDAEAVGHHVQHLARPGGRGDLALGLHAREAAGGQPLLHFLGVVPPGKFHREGHHQARVPGARALHQLLVDGLRRVVPHLQRGLPVEQLRRAREQQLQVVVELRHRAHRRARGADRVGLVDGDRRRHALHAVHRRLVHALQELPRVGREGLDVAALAFGVQRVEHQARLAGAAGARGPPLAGAQVEVEILEEDMGLAWLGGPPHKLNII